jgi:hypothetical protein
MHCFSDCFHDVLLQPGDASTSITLCCGAAVQAALAERLSEMVLQLPEQVSLLYYIVFIKTLRREWFGIDHLRLDKFLMLVRKFSLQVLKLLQAADWCVAESGLLSNTVVLACACG